MTIPHQCLEGKKAGDAYCMDRNQILTAIRRAIKFNYKYFGTGLAVSDYAIQSIGLYEEEPADDYTPVVIANGNWMKDIKEA
jgi:hypothetical protein